MEVEVSGIIDNADAYQAARMKRADWKPHVEALAASMKDPAVGQLVPILIRPGPTAICHELVAGFARLEAAKLLGWSHIRAELMLPTRDTARARFTENDARLASSIVENAAFAGSFKNAEEAAKAIGGSKSAAEQLRRLGVLFGKEPEYALAVEAGRIYPSVLQLVPARKLPGVQAVADLCETFSAREVIRQLTGKKVKAEEGEAEEGEAEEGEAEEGEAEEGEAEEGATSKDTWKSLLVAIWDHVDIRKVLEEDEPELHARIKAFME